MNEKQPGNRKKRLILITRKAARESTQSWWQAGFQRQAAGPWALSLPTRASQTPRSGDRGWTGVQGAEDSAWARGRAGLAPARRTDTTRSAATRGFSERRPGADGQARNTVRGVSLAQRAGAHRVLHGHPVPQTCPILPFPNTHSIQARRVQRTREGPGRRRREK